jgi:rod shape determining protein RodA
VFEKVVKVDRWMVLLLLVFMVAGTFIVYSATRANEKFVNMEIKNLINYGIGFLVLFLVLQFNYRWLLRYVNYIYAGSIMLLILVFPFGAEINGAKGWFRLGIGFDIQPAELMKLSLILLLAERMGRREGQTLRFLEDVIPLAFYTFVPFVLVMLQPDLGNAIIYVVILLGMLWIGNVKLSHVLIGTAMVILLGTVFLWLYSTQHHWFEAHLKPHWVQRIDTFLDPTSVSKDASYQLDNSIRAIGSGGMYGEGYMQGTAVQKQFIPYPYSDSIFVVVAEEFGFIGSAVLIVLYFMLFSRMLSIAEQTTDDAGSYVVIGILSMLVFQVFENVGMLIGLMPLTGITLPFISYGGSSLLMNMCSIGLVFSILVHQGKLNDLMD